MPSPEKFLTTEECRAAFNRPKCSVHKMGECAGLLEAR